MKKLPLPAKARIERLIKNLWLIGLTLVTFSCKTTKPDVIYDSVSYTEERMLDTLFVSAPAISQTQEEEKEQVPVFKRPSYRPSAKRINDLLHTKLELRFDWAQEKVIGKATLRFKPYFYPAAELVLDAKNFEIQQVQLLPAAKNLSYEYDGKQLRIQLDRTYRREETYTIAIDYIASPNATGGSSAITSDKGLFFINPDGKDPNKPRQIWTQGETENNSRWFPTIDKPNERCTQEMLLTVEKKLTTLSNGSLISSTDNGDGSRTDYWKMDQPHAPYLFMLAIGEYALVKEYWKDVLVEYYVEPDFEKDAKVIFPHTVEMLDFFSEKLGMKYPWPKYAQVVVRDYVSGAMENTTAVIYGEFMQLPARELIDERQNEKIVAHELIHHWFGDLVTCESWANLSLNESFASYGEYLWLEHKYGKDEADYHMLGEWNNYLSTGEYALHPLINFAYADREDMFDRHSYEKGGAILHMLRNYVGDDAFFSALNLYLSTHQYQSAEAHDLRLAFEKVTGEDLNWFFNQWYFAQGHPELELDYNYIDSTQTFELAVRQTQDSKYHVPVYKIPVDVNIHFSEDSILRQSIIIDEREQRFQFKLADEPQLVVFDPNKILLTRVQDDKSEEQMVFQYAHAPSYMDRYLSVITLAESNHPKAKDVLIAALEDKHWTIRSFALQQFDTTNVSDKIRAKLRSLAENDPHSIVRMSALDKLTELKDGSSIGLVKSLLKSEQSYPVLTAALFLLMEVDLQEAVKAGEQFQGEENNYVLEAVELIFVESGDPRHLPFFERNFQRFDGFGALAFIDSYQTLLLKNDLELIRSGTKKLEELAADQGVSYWLRLAGTKALNDIATELRSQSSAVNDQKKKKEIKQFVETLISNIQRIKEQEKDEKLIEIYKQLRP